MKISKEELKYGTMLGLCAFALLFGGLVVFGDVEWPENAENCDGAEYDEKPLNLIIFPIAMIFVFIIGTVIRFIFWIKERRPTDGLQPTT